MLKVIDEQTNTFHGKIYGKNYTIERVVKIFSNEGQYRVRVDQTKNIEGKGSLKSFNYFKCNSLQEAQEKADYVLKTEDYGAIWEQFVQIF